MGLTGSLGMLVAVVSYLYGSALERNLEAREFERLAQVQFQNTQELLHRSTSVLYAFSGLFAASREIDRDAYARYAASILPHHPEVYAVHWAPKITAAQRADFEREIHDLQLTPLGVFNVDIATRRLQPAAPRELLLPVRYSAPLAANLKIIGLDAFAQPSNHATIHAAIATGRQRLTPAFSLFQDPDGPLATALFQPVFAEGPPLGTSEQRWQNLEGFLILILRPGLLLEKLPFGEFKVDLRLYDLQDGKPVAIHPLGATMRAPARNVVHHRLQLPGSTWILEFVTSEGFDNRIHLQPLLLMLSLLLLTLAGLFFLDRSYHAARALREANGELLLRQRELNELAHHDALTGLANRLLLCDRIGQALADLPRHGGDLAVCLLDLDGFKEVNDRFGHGAGDRVLCEVASRIKAVVRPSDTVARLGGDEFVVVLPRLTSSAALERILQRLIECVGRPITLGDIAPPVRVSASIGVAFADAHADADMLLHQADAAMYEAKSAGKDCYRIFAGAEAPQEPAQT